MTFDKVKNNPSAFIEALGEICGSIDEVSYVYHKAESVTVDDSTYTVETVLSDGGGEGDGEHVDRVLKVTSEGETIYIRYTGFYSSYEGTDWDVSSSHLVVPREVTVTQYFSA